MQLGKQEKSGIPCGLAQWLSYAGKHRMHKLKPKLFICYRMRGQKE